MTRRIGIATFRLLCGGPLRRLAAVLLALTLGTAAVARAASCSFMSVSPMNFGPYDVFNPSPTDSVSNISYSCNGGATLTIGLSAGATGTFGQRRLVRAGTFTMNYNLYMDAGHTAIWGDGTGGSMVSGPTMPADGVVVMVPIFGRIPAGQDVGLGTYTDTITVTLNF
jgi:spore coat protein U-like protein